MPDPFKQIPPGYDPLARVLGDALLQAAAGKGRERHSTGQPFMEQPIVTITRRYGLGYPMGQAEKKMEESTRLKPGPAIRELHGAMVYLAAAVLLLEEQERQEYRTLPHLARAAEEIFPRQPEERPGDPVARQVLDTLAKDPTDTAARQEARRILGLPEQPAPENHAFAPQSVTIAPPEVGTP